MYNNPYNYYPYMNMPRSTFNNLNNFNTLNGNIPNYPIRPTNSFFKGGIFKGLSNVKWSDVLSNTQI